MWVESNNLYTDTNPITLPCSLARTGNEPGSIAIVVSPLVALMKDQVEAMKKRGISAVYVGDSSGHDITTKIAQEHFNWST